jgi:AcrR family transcriptional regulator
MSRPVASPRAASPPDIDGRRRRGLDNRARIVAAMLDIVRGGELAPSAEQVADRADVGLRTVFRHFQDMDSLYREMSVVIEGEMAAVIAAPFRAQTWQGRVLELVARRSVGFEKIAPFQRAAAVTRHRSRFLSGDNAKLARISRQILLHQLPEDVAADAALVEALDLVLSFEAWSRLRVEQGLTTRGAREVLEAMVRKLLPEAAP